MSDKILDNLLKRHNEVLSKLEECDSVLKKNKSYLTVVALTAVLGGGGGATALIKNDDESVKTAVATHVAVYEEWKPKVSEDISIIKEKIGRLTAITAFLSGGGSNVVEEDTAKAAMAAHVAVYEEWKPKVSEDLDMLRNQVSALREALIRIQVTTEGLSEKHRGSNSELQSRLDEVESLLDEADSFQSGSDGGKINPAPERIRQLKKELFND